MPKRTAALLAATLAAVLIASPAQADEDLPGDQGTPQPAYTWFGPFLYEYDCYQVRIPHQQAGYRVEPCVDLRPTWDSRPQWYFKRWSF
ncbi:hypothetical protein FAF44_43300 [Nonomuraea sp. MG754425]|uniref:hypothetical protein n=1 Tax=Nonomuraea sp. MG754425 TaxID=2570319 RepID=UPI001F1BE71D|nr:hypothetical protein [Nonomuraea sp. MG754425]MCF6475152.1 hypothetical protein [Nonomuraea sp. MG754425]